MQENQLNTNKINQEIKLNFDFLMKMTLWFYLLHLVVSAFVNEYINIA